MEGIACVGYDISVLLWSCWYLDWISKWFSVDNSSYAVFGFDEPSLVCQFLQKMIKPRSGGSGRSCFKVQKLHMEVVRQTLLPWVGYSEVQFSGSYGVGYLKYWENVGDESITIWTKHFKDEKSACSYLKQIMMQTEETVGLFGSNLKRRMTDTVVGAIQTNGRARVWGDFKNGSILSFPKSALIVKWGF